MQEINREEARKAMRKMKGGKVVDPNNILVEAWRCLGDMSGMILGGERMQEEWRKKVPWPRFSKSRAMCKRL